MRPTCKSSWAAALQGSSAFAASLQPDGSHSASLDCASADALFQIEWRDTEGLHRTGASSIRQSVDTRRLDLSLQATPQGSNHGLTVRWNLADVLAAGDIAFEQIAGQPASYSVYIGMALSSGQAPNTVQATLVDGVFVAQFDNLREGSRTTSLQYARPDGSLVNATPVQTGPLAGLDTRLQNLEFGFPDTDTSGAALSVRTRPAGSTSWTSLPASAINGLLANLLGLSSGGYEYEATLTRGSYTVHALKFRNTTTTGTPPVTTTPVADIGASIVVGPLTFTDVMAQALQGSRELTAYALERSENVGLVTLVARPGLLRSGGRLIPRGARA